MPARHLRQYNFFMGFLPLKKFLNPEYLQKGKIICGIDEVGRGPWAGPLLAAAIIFTKDIRIHGCADSKKLTAEQREKILKKLEKIAYYGIGLASVEEIDEHGLTRATTLAYLRALQELEQKQHHHPDFIVIDGRDQHQLPYPSKSIIKGDEKLKIIACASIIAKVKRDAIMKKLARKYPQYGFNQHKGYGTRMHQQALVKHGPCALHRKSFMPIRTAGLRLLTKKFAIEKARL